MRLVYELHYVSVAFALSIKALAGAKRMEASRELGLMQLPHDRDRVRAEGHSRRAESYSASMVCPVPMVLHLPVVCPVPSAFVQRKGCSASMEPLEKTGLGVDFDLPQFGDHPEVGYLGHLGHRTIPTGRHHPGSASHRKQGAMTDRF